MEASDAQPGAANSGRHRAPDGDAQTAFIPRVTDGVPGGPLDPAAALGASAPHPSSPPQDFVAGLQPAAPRPSSPASARPVGGDAPVSAADTAVLPTNPPA